MYCDVVFWLIWEALKKLPVIHAMHPLIISLCLFQILFLIPVTLRLFASFTHYTCIRAVSLVPLRFLFVLKLSSAPLS